ncbi:MAG: hypothetical protein PHU06_06305 [Gallionella sp.]|nr:hypothetical protein [Gallionella sp.]MDD4958422.1 hypothetical protein [Gallionella sp.]
MRAYRVSNPSSPGKYTYCGSMTEVSKAKAALKEAGIKNADILVEDAEIPTDKAGLLAWLNANT